MNMIDYIVWTVVHLGAWSLMLIASAGVGNLFLRKLSFQSSIERLVFTEALGLGLCALALFAMGLFGVLYQTVIVALTILGAVATILHWFYSGDHYPLLAPAWWKKQYWGQVQWRQYYRPRRALVILLMTIGLCYWGLLLLSTQYPPVHWDAISTHLVLARSYLVEHYIVVDTGTISPVLPALNHMLFTWALALKDDILAQMVEHTFLMLTALGLYAWGKRQNRPELGFAAAAFWLSHPLVLWLAASAYIDIGITCFVFLGVYALRIFWDYKLSAWWYLGLALLSMAAGTKLPGLFFLGVGVILGLWVLFQSFIISKILGPKNKNASDDTGQAQGRFTLRPLIQGWAIAVIIAVPWYAFIAYHTGNPIWPTFPEYSRGIWGAPWLVESVHSWMKNAGEPRTIRNFIMLPLDWILHPDRFFAEVHLSLFPLIVAWPLAWIISLFNRSVRWWTLWALAFTGFWFLNPHQLRYWLPVLPIAGLALYESIRWLLERISISTEIHGTIWKVLALVMLLWGGRAVYGEIKAKGLPPPTADAREAFLSTLGGYNGVKYVNKRAEKNDAVCILGASWLNYYFQPRFIDLRGALHLNRQPSFKWPNDEVWVQWLEFKNAKWVFVYHKDEVFNISKQNPVLTPFWPDYQLVYADSTVWVFRRKPVPPDVSLDFFDRSLCGLSVATRGARLNPLEKGFVVHSFLDQL